MTPFASKTWQPLARRILMRDGRRCQIRGDKCEGAATDVDHIWSWRFGQRFWFDPSNLRAACRPCNRGRRTELVVVGADLLPAGCTASASEIVLADISSGRMWLLDVASRSLRTPDQLAPVAAGVNDEW